MSDISLPYSQVCEIIQDVAADWVCDLSDYEPEASHYQQFGHTLWRALEDAHLAKEAKGV